MAAGDIVNGIGPAPSTWYYFQPAAGVEIMISSVNGGDTLGGLYNGVNNASGPMINNASAINTKTFIDNTNYFAYYAQVGALSAYSGIQIK